MEFIIIQVFILLTVRCLVHYGNFWRLKLSEAAYSAAQEMYGDYLRERYCEWAVMAGNTDACMMYQFDHLDSFEKLSPMTTFRHKGIDIVFYGYYFPKRYHEYIKEEQKDFCKDLYNFKDGNIHGIEFFKSCLGQLTLEENTLIMFMPCSNDIKYRQRFSRLNWYIWKHRHDLTSGLNYVDIYEPRESLHSAKGAANRILERNYDIIGDISGRNIVIVDDVLTTGTSLLDYKDELERHGGKVTGAIFYGKTVAKPKISSIKRHVWIKHILHRE